MNTSIHISIAGALILTSLVSTLTIAEAATTGGPAGGAPSGAPSGGGASGSADTGDRGGGDDHQPAGRRGILPAFPVFQMGFATRFPPQPTADGYPTLGKAISNCGGINNVMKVTVYDHDGTVGPVTYYCAD
ncbi:MAG: hypothetical protein KDJ80_14675 [Nitratireductor sp.]|nr:hypothetical protein [Nitratireductor sp.]